MTKKRLFRPTLTDLGVLDGPSEPEFDTITNCVAEFTNCPVALISIIDEGADRQFFKSSVGLGEPWSSLRQTPLTHSFCKHVKASNLPLIVQNAHEHALVRHNLAVPELGVIAYLGVPVRGYDGAPIGALCAIDGEARRWTRDDLIRLTRMADLARDQIRLRAELMISARREAELRQEVKSRRKAQSELKKRAATDELTGLMNRGAFSSAVSKEIARARRSGADLSLVLVDIDRFKRINDTLGHAAGDQVLQEIAKRFDAARREGGDLVARWGGEEFAFLLTDANPTQARAAAERCRAVISAAPILLDGGAEWAATASFGVARIPLEGGLDAAYRQADAALYQAKAAGRDRVQVADLSAADDRAAETV